MLEIGCKKPGVWNTQYAWRREMQGKWRWTEGKWRGSLKKQVVTANKQQFWSVGTLESTGGGSSGR